MKKTAYTIGRRIEQKIKASEIERILKRVEMHPHDRTFLDKEIAKFPKDGLKVKYRPIIINNGLTDDQLRDVVVGKLNKDGLVPASLLKLCLKDFSNLKSALYLRNLKVSTPLSVRKHAGIEVFPFIVKDRLERKPRLKFYNHVLPIQGKKPILLFEEV
jgi:hypothetical protein